MVQVDVCAVCRVISIPNNAAETCWAYMLKTKYSLVILSGFDVKDAVLGQAKPECLVEVKPGSVYADDPPASFLESLQIVFFFASEVVSDIVKDHCIVA
jgi:hypothetical protein